MPDAPAPVTNEVKTAQAEAHKTSVQESSTKFFESARDAMSGGHHTNLALAEKLTTDLVNTNLLPSMSLAYLNSRDASGRDVFDSLDVLNGPKDGAGNEKGKGLVSLNEIEAAIAARSRPGGKDSLDVEMLKEVRRQMNEGKLDPNGVSKDDIRKALETSNDNYQKQDRENARDAVQLLLNHPEWLARLDGANGANGNDKIFGQKDLTKLLENPPDDLKNDPNAMEKLKWLRDNWNDKDLDPFKNDVKTDGGYMEFKTEKNTMANGLRMTAPNPVPSDAVAPPADRPPSTVGQGPSGDARSGQRPDDQFRALDASGRWGGHDDYYRRADGSTVALDRDPDSGMVTGITTDNGGNITAWKYDQANKKWTQWKGSELLAEADNVLVDVNTGRVNPINVRTRTRT